MAGKNTFSNLTEHILSSKGQDFFRTQPTKSSRLIYSAIVRSVEDQASQNRIQAEIVNKDNHVFTFIHEKTTPIKNENKDLIYSLDYNSKINYNRSILQAHNELTNKIKNFFILDKVYYQDNNVGNTIHNYLKECKGGF